MHDQTADDIEGNRVLVELQEKSSQHDIPLEPWESNPGTITGEVVYWYPNHEFNLLIQAGLIDMENKQLAISAAAIATQEVENAFQYAKTLSEDFFNVGVIDLPPGGEKRRKNSRRMFMAFFVHMGRILVTIDETSFRISKGGI